MIDSQKTNFSKMALSLRQNNMNPNPLALFHDICRHIKCHLRNQNRQKFHFSNMGPHCEIMKRDESDNLEIPTLLWFRGMKSDSL